jgi:hypothetical protein
MRAQPVGAQTFAPTSGWPRTACPSLHSFLYLLKSVNFEGQNILKSVDFACIKVLKSVNLRCDIYFKC